MIHSLSATFARKSPAPCARLIAALAFCAGLAVLSGCASGRVAPGGPGATQVAVLKETPSPSEIVVEQGGVPPAACVISVNQPPPAPPKNAKAIPKRPGPNFVWLAGNWRYYSGRYVWIPGSWSLPPKPKAVYTPPRWTVVNGNNMFTEGYWHF